MGPKDVYGPVLSFTGFDENVICNHWPDDDRQDGTVPIDIGNRNYAGRTRSQHNLQYPKLEKKEDWWQRQHLGSS